MPWHLERRENRWCVIKDADSSVAGCHDSRADAIKQQRALYANESRVAAMYADLDSRPAPEPPQERPVTSANGQELVKVVVGSDNEALTASMMQQMERMNERQARTDEALIAALHAIGERETQMTFSAPITVEPTPITVEPAITVAPTPVHVTVDAPQVTVEPPQVTVQAEITTPYEPRERRIQFQRNLEGRVTGATVEE